MNFAVHVNGFTAHRATAHMPARGLWVARVTLDEPVELERDEAVQLELGDLTLAGHVYDGAVFAQSATYEVVAGKGGWRKTVREKPYKSPSGVKLSLVLQELARDAGEEWTAGFGPAFADRSVGYGYTRLARPAVEVLHRLLGRAWYVGDDGKTVIGDRPAGRAAADVLDYRASARHVQLDAEELSKVRPGQSVSVGDAPLVLGAVLFSTGRRGSLEGFGED